MTGRGKMLSSNTPKLSFTIIAVDDFQLLDLHGLSLMSRRVMRPQSARHFRRATPPGSSLRIPPDGWPKSHGQLAWLLVLAHSHGVILLRDAVARQDMRDARHFHAFYRRTT